MNELAAIARDGLHEIPPHDVGCGATEIGSRSQDVFQLIDLEASSDPELAVIGASSWVMLERETGAWLMGESAAGLSLSILILRR